MRLFFADALTDEEALKLVRRLRERSERLEHGLRAECIPLADAAARRGRNFPLLTARFGADFQAWSAQWSAALEDELTRSHSAESAATRYDLDQV